LYDLVWCPYDGHQRNHYARKRQNRPSRLVILDFPGLSLKKPAQHLIAVLAFLILKRIGRPGNHVGFNARTFWAEGLAK